MMTKLAYLGLLLAICFNPFSADAQKVENFNGLYIGLSTGTQNIFGGAFIDGVDVLAQKSGAVLDWSAGYRKQLINNRIVIGAEFSYGLTDGNLEVVDARNQLRIQYENNTQIAVGLQLGWAFGKKRSTLLYIFGNQTRRRFDISFTTSDGIIHQQEDTQNFERLGLGIELPINDKWSLRANVAKTFVDYGDLITTIDVEGKLDYNLGIIFSF